MLSVHSFLKQIGNCRQSLLNLAAVSSSTGHTKLHSLPKLLTISEESKTSLKNLSEIKNAPASALVYGVSGILDNLRQIFITLMKLFYISGLIPFTAVPAFMFQTSMFIPELAYAHLAYSAVILSFLGGVRWGSSISNPDVIGFFIQNNCFIFIYLCFFLIYRP